MKSPRYLLLTLIPIFLLTTACPLFNLWGERPESVNNITPDPLPCVVTTGERPYPPVITGRPRETARPGDTLTITFTGGYLVLPKCEKRDGKEYYQYLTVKELSEKKWRTAVIQLDGKGLASVRCGHECRLDFSLPAETKTRERTLTILTGGGPFFDPQDTTFTIKVMEK